MHDSVVILWRWGHFYSYRADIPREEDGVEKVRLVPVSMCYFTQHTIRTSKKIPNLSFWGELIYKF